MYCKKCGNELSEDSIFCNHCGESQNNEEAHKKPKSLKIYLSVSLIADIICLLCVVFMIVQYHNLLNKTNEVLKTSDSGIVYSDENSNTSDDFDIGNYHIKYLSAKILNEHDKKILVVNLNFKNNSNENASYLYSIDSKAFQNGIQLTEPLIASDGYSFNEKNAEVQPGIAHDIQIAFYLDDNKSNVELQFSKLFSSNIDKTITISIDN